MHAKLHLPLIFFLELSIIRLHCSSIRLQENGLVMPKSNRKIKAKMILADVRAGMAESNLMKKYRLSQKDLQTVYGKMKEAGLAVPQVSEGPIPVDHALIPLEKKSRDVQRESHPAEQRRRLRELRREQKAREESEKLLRIVDSTFHWWLMLIGVVSLGVGACLYIAGPYLEILWMEDLALERTLNLQGPTQRSYDLWLWLATVVGPITALLGGMVTAVGGLKWWLNARKLRSVIERHRQGLVFSASRDEEANR
jgi:hypothetical protein